MKKVAFHTLGCKVNQYETEAMEELFLKKGYEVVNEDDVADVYVINTCTVTNMSASKSRQFIRKAKRSNKDSIVAVVGCYSQISPEEVEEIEGVDVVLGTTDRNKIVDLCEMSLKEEDKINIVRDLKHFNEFEDISVTDMESMTRAYIKIQDGCNQYCSYCIIPYARGPIRSRELSDILAEVRNLVSQGYKEVILTGIHVASYGKDLEGVDLSNVIEEISKIEGIQRIRLSSVEPGIITDEFMEIVTKTNKLCDHFHLSLQSGSDSVLKRMNRKYDTEDFTKRVETIRKYMPEAGITTDIIVGFPKETDEEFMETMEFVEKIVFSRVHVFKYSKREGTPAAKMINQVDGNIKNKRSRQLINSTDKLAEEFSRNFIGRQMEVLFEERVDDYNEGYTTNYLRVRVYGDKDLAGQLIETKIIDYKEDQLIGEI